jgi:hypothetical protein
VRELLDLHYDPIYRRSLDKNFGTGPRTGVAWDGDDASLRAIARDLAEA